MTEPASEQPPARLESFELRVRMDATLSINDNTHWVKPGAEGAVTWKGHEWNGQWVDPIPTKEELAIAFRLIQTGILSSVLEELIEVSQRKIMEAQQRR